MDKHICKAKVIYGCSWGKQPGQWVYGYYVALPDEYTHGEDICHAIFELYCEHVYMGEYKDDGWYKVDPDTVCRFTGKEDKHGNPIFENDIVISKSNIPMTVHWDNANALFDVIYEMDGIGWCANTLCDSERLEIIGNVFNNT